MKVGQKVKESRSESQGKLVGKLAKLFEKTRKVGLKVMEVGKKVNDFS